ncbi:MAG: GNAT family N-acetyltransferase [Desulfobacteraceae bacterium]|nr:GNAT family N-acetyltransferase [Desulfobacteraceae bacterium]
MPYPFTNKEIAQALYEALTKDPFYITMEQGASKDTATAKEAMLRYMDYSMEEARTHGELRIPKNKNHGASIWSKPVDAALGQQISKEKKQFLQNHLGLESLDTYCKIVDFMSDKSREVVSEKYWYLSILGVTPKLQGKGLGLDLVMPVLKKIDKLGAATYLETFIPENIGFYKGMGFYEAKTVHEPVTDADYTIMIRDSK